jgi:hypothetical protein
MTAPHISPTTADDVTAVLVRLLELIHNGLTENVIMTKR